MGLEPTTSAVTGRRSNQLNYEAVFIKSTADDRRLFKKWWELQGSNLWPSVCKTDALPAELNSHIVADISTALICYHIPLRLSSPDTKKILTILKTRPLTGKTSRLMFSADNIMLFWTIFPEHYPLNSLYTYVTMIMLKEKEEVYMKKNFGKTAKRTVCLLLTAVILLSCSLFT